MRLRNCAETNYDLNILAAPFGWHKDVLLRLADAYPRARVTSFDAKRPHIAFQVEDADKGWGVVHGTMTLSVSRNPNNGLELEIEHADAAQPGNGWMRQSMKFLIQFAQGAGISRLGLVATDVGAYAWARYGFIPTPQSWNYLACNISNIMRETPEVPKEARDEILRATHSEYPRGIRIVAAAKHPVAYAIGEKKFTTTLGKYLLAEATCCNYGTGAMNWDGELDLKNAADVAYALKYCNAVPKIDPSHIDYEVTPPLHPGLVRTVLVLSR